MEGYPKRFERLDRQTDKLESYLWKIGIGFLTISRDERNWRLIDRESMGDGWSVTMSDEPIGPTVKAAFATLRRWFK